MSTPFQASDHAREHLLALHAQVKHRLQPAGALGRHRADAAAHFARLGLPTHRDERWRQTPLEPLWRTAFQLPPPGAPELPLATVERLSRLAPGPRLVFVDGRLAPALCADAGLPDGVVFQALSQARGVRRLTVDRHLGQVARFQDHPFTALTDALWEDGALLEVPEGVRVEGPVTVAFVSTARPALTRHVRLLAVLHPRAEAVLTELHLGTEHPGRGGLTGEVAELVLGGGARLSRAKLLLEAAGDLHLSRTEARLAAGARFDSQLASFGAALSRDEVGVALEGPGAACHLGGLLVASGRQHLEHHTRVDHDAPAGESRQLFKAVVDDAARGVFEGRVRVREGAAGTDAAQTARSLLLSPDALVRARPQLEIHADDVKCTHGAALGELDEEALFYLRSRGIDRPLARALLIHAFACEVLEPIADPLARAAARGALEARLPARLDPKEVTS